MSASLGKVPNGSHTLKSARAAYPAARPYGFSAAASGVLSKLAAYNVAVSLQQESPGIYVNNLTMPSWASNSTFPEAGSNQYGSWFLGSPASL